jgi:hypothetical protein
LPDHVAFIDQTTVWASPQTSAADAFGTTGDLQCVPFARLLSGIGIHGDAWTWWDKASGLYARGNHPEAGAVLSFPGIERMPLGHVAVVTRVVSARKILIDHANWPNAIEEHGAISRDIQVEDVSPDNDWTEVRVQFGEGGPMGSVYPANGFIYGWNDTGVRIAQSRISPDERSRAAAGVSRGRPLLVLRVPAGSLLNTRGLVQPLGVSRLSAGRSGFAMSRYEVKWASLSR